MYYIHTMDRVEKSLTNKEVWAELDKFLMKTDGLVIQAREPTRYLGPLKIMLLIKVADMLIDDTIDQLGEERAAMYEEYLDTYLKAKGVKVTRRKNE